jgi:hypothetical protein
MDGTKLAYIKFTGGASTLAHEQCQLCQNDIWINHLEKKIIKVTEDLTELLNNANDTSDYREGIIDVLDTLGWCRKI